MSSRRSVLEWLGDRKLQFDLIVSLDLIEHFQREEALRFLDLCFAALKPDGRLILANAERRQPVWFANPIWRHNP